MKSLQNNFFAPNDKEILPEVFKIYVGQKFSMILRTHGKRNGIPCELTKNRIDHLRCSCRVGQRTIRGNKTTYIQPGIVGDS